MIFAAQIQPLFRGGLKCGLKFLQMHLSPDALGSHIIFQSVFDDVKSRETEVHQSCFCQQSEMGDNTESNILWKVTLI